MNDSIAWLIILLALLLNGAGCAWIGSVSGASHSHWATKLGILLGFVIGFVCTSTLLYVEVNLWGMPLRMASLTVLFVGILPFIY